MRLDASLRHLGTAVDWLAQPGLTIVVALFWAGCQLLYLVTRSFVCAVLSTLTEMGTDASPSRSVAQRATA